MSQPDPEAASAATAVARSRLYALLAAAFRYPLATFYETLSAGHFLSQVQDASAGLPYQLPNVPALADPRPSLAALQQTYSQLFDVGAPGAPPCCLYESEYGGGRLGVMEDVLRFYRFFGLRLSEEERERPDHLAIELEFLHWLTFQEAEARSAGNDQAAQAYTAAARDFLAAHAGELAGQVAARVAISDAFFYPELAKLAATLCSLDHDYLVAGGHAAVPGAGAGAGTELSLELHGLWEAERPAGWPEAYNLRTLRALPIPWDRIVKSSHLPNCWYQRACNLNLYVWDGVVLREEQVGNYPAPNDPSVPDANPRGCQKGVCYAHRTYDPARIKYPLKRVGQRGGGQWQRVSWDEALTEVADGVLDVLTTDGPTAILQAGGTQVYSQASEGMGLNAFFEALGSPLPSPNVEIGDDHQGAAVTMGKVIFADSADNWFHADVILVWGGNPAYTNVPNYHYIAEARYKGTQVIVISPDYNASAVHADLWVPVNVGADAALAMGMCQVIIKERLYREEFVREQTDLPLLVRVDNGRLLREKDLRRGGREDIFYLYDQAAGRVVEAPRKSLALDGLVPALEGEYQAQTTQGPVRVRPVFELLREHVNSRFTPKQTAAITGTPVALIERLAREVAAAKGVVNISTSNWGKFYHGDLIERATILVHALTGNIGRKGGSFSAFPLLTPDTAIGSLERHGHQMVLAAAGADPRYAAWREDGYTTEMILYEYTKQAVASGALGLTALTHFFHSGILELGKRHQNWDPDLKRPVGDYVDEALNKGWQVVVPAPDKEPRMMFQVGGNILRRSRATNQLLETLLPKLKLVVTVDSRMTGTALYSDVVLPACGWYERTSTPLLGPTQSPYLQVIDKAVEPLYESLSDWTIFVRLARKLVQRGKERGIHTFLDKDGKERRLDRVVDAVTSGGLYEEEDEDGVARDAFVNSGNVEQMSWEEFKERGIAAYTGIGSGVRTVGNACDLVVGEPVVPLTWHTERKDPYPTLTRRMQFYIDHDWYMELDEQLPTHKDCPKAGGDYPLQLTSGHGRWSIHSMWADDAIMLGLQRGEPTMFMSQADAAARGVQDGDPVEVHNDVGSFRIQAVVSPTVRPGEVIVYHTWENYQFQGWRHFKNVMPSPLNPIELVGGYGHLRPDVFGFAPGQNDRGTRVEVSKWDERCESASSSLGGP